MQDIARRAALEGLAVTAAELSRRPVGGYIRLGELGTDAMRIAADAQRLSTREPERPEVITVQLSGREYTPADLHGALDRLGDLAAAPAEKWFDEEHLAAVRVASRVVAFAAFRIRDRKVLHPRVLAWAAAGALLVFLVLVMPGVWGW